jgi:hypothetical protein
MHGKAQPAMCEEFMHPLEYIIVGLTGLTDPSSDKDNIS